MNIENKLYEKGMEALGLNDREPITKEECLAKIYGEFSIIKLESLALGEEFASMSLESQGHVIRWIHKYISLSIEEEKGGDL